MAPTPHNDLHPAARDHSQEEGREESQSDLSVKHCHCPCESPVLLGGLQIGHRYGQRTFFTSYRAEIRRDVFGAWERSDRLGGSRLV